MNSAATHTVLCGASQLCCARTSTDRPRIHVLRSIGRLHYLNFQLAIASHETCAPTCNPDRHGLRGTADTAIPGIFALRTEDAIAPRNTGTHSGTRSHRRGDQPGSRRSGTNGRQGVRSQRPSRKLRRPGHVWHGSVPRSPADASAGWFEEQRGGGRMY